MNIPKTFLAIAAVTLLLTGPLMGLEPVTEVQATHTGDHDWVAPVDGETLLPTGPMARHFRAQLEVEAPGMQGVQNLPVQKVLDLKEILAHQARYPAQETSGGRITLSGFHLDMDSFLLREIDEDGHPINDRFLPLIVERGSVDGDGSFHPSREPVVTLRWSMPGPTDGPRYFHVYFDSNHNEPGPGPRFTTQEELSVVTSIGPGRGTTHFIPLSPLAGSLGPNEPRRAHVTALHDDTTVQFHEYIRGIPNPTPVETATLAQAGDTHEYRLGERGTASSTGSVMVVSDRPVLVEALSIQGDGRNSFVPNDFIPSADGGFLGTRFLASPAMNERWHVFCPTLGATDNDCRISINNGSPVTMNTNSTRTQDMPAGQPASITSVDDSMVMVQRTQAGTTHGLTAWPAVDGPHVSRQFIGHAERNDQFSATAFQSDTCILVYSSGSGNFLTQNRPPNHWCLSQGPILERFNKRWPTDEDHQTGGLQLTAFTGNGFSFKSGSQTIDSSLVVPQSPDGGSTYQVHVPADSDGNPLGQIVVYALYDGTAAEATRQGGGSRELPSMIAGERQELNVNPGLWTIEGNRPIVVAWLNHRTQDYGAYAPGFTDAANVELLGADYVGYALDLRLQGSSFLQREPGDRVEFTALVTNQARAVNGEGLPDSAHITMRTPGDDWDPRFDLTTRSLEPGETGAFTMSLRIPEAVERGSGVTIPIRVTSENNPELVVETSLQINFIVRRGVEVREATGLTDQVVSQEETAVYHVQVFNRGSAPDSFMMQFVCPPEGWQQSIISMDLQKHEQPTEVRCDEPGGITTSEIAPREQVSFFVEMSAGEEVRQASRTVTRVSATSSGDHSVTDSLRLSTIAGAERSFRVLVDEPTRTVEPGEAATFNLTILNEADVNEELLVEIHSALPHGWDEQALDVRWVEEDTPHYQVIPLEPNGEATLSVTRTVPLDARALDLSLDRVRMQSQFDRDAAASDTALRILVAALRGVEASVEAPVRPVEPGEPSRFTLRMDSIGNVNQSIQVKPLFPEGDWSALDAHGEGGPWSIELPGFGSIEIPVMITPDPATPPGVAAGSLDFELSGMGFSSKSVGVVFDVDERRSVHVEPRTVRLDPGRLMELEVPVLNTGNVPLELHGEWEGLPDWEVSSEPLSLVPGEEGVLSMWLLVPSELASGDGFSASLNLLHGSRSLALAQWEFLVNVPGLEARIDEIRMIDGNQASYRVSVTNTGHDVARNVSVLLEHDEEGTLDRFLILQIRPGATAMANLVGPGEPEGVSIRVSADHDPEGFRITATQPGLEDQAIPATGIMAVVVLLLVFRVWGRRRIVV